MSDPLLSVVIVPLLEAQAAATLVSELTLQGALPEGTEVLVVTESPTSIPGARVVLAPAHSTIPERRALGVRVARGEIIALLEDTIRPNPRWGAAVVESHERFRDTAAIGGTLSVARTVRGRALALVALDYGPFLRRGTVSEPAVRVPGNNMSFKRGPLERAGAFEARGFREAELVGSLGRDGGVRTESSVGGTCVGVDPRGATLESRFNHGRLYAGTRFQGPRRAQRVARAMSTPLLAMLLVARGARALRKGGSGWVQSLPHLAWMSAAWSLGESVGYLLGPGRAEESWR